MDQNLQLLAEHQGAGQLETKPGESYTAPPEEVAAIDLVKKLFRKSKAHRSLYDTKWVEDYHFFRGRQWERNRPSYRHTEVINLVFQNIQSMVPLLTDIKPRFSFLPQEPQDREIAEILNEVAEADWEKNNWSREEYEVILNAAIYGTGLSSLEYDEEKAYGLGGMCFESEDTVYCYPDPEARDVDNQCDFFIKLEFRDIDKLRRKYPEKGMYIQADAKDLIRGEKNDLGEVMYKSPTSNNLITDSQPARTANESDRALVITAYILDPAMIEEEKDKGDGSKSYVQKKKYPKGRKVVIAGGVIVEDGPSKFDHGKLPYQRFVNYPLPDEFWGMGDVDQLKGPQRTFNKLASFTLDVLTMMGAPVWIVDYEARVETDNLINRPGLVVEKAKGSEVRREEGVQLQPWVMQMLDRYRQYCDDIGGAQEVTRGANPSGVTAAQAIEELQQAAQTRVRQKARNLDIWLQQLGEQYLSNVLQWYTAPKVYRLTAKDGSQKYFKMAVETTPEGQKVISKQEMAPSGEFGIVNKYQITGEFDVKVMSGSSIPFNQAKKRKDLFDLFDRGIIDSEEVLRGIDFPNYQAILERMQAAAAQQQMAPKA